MILAGLSFEVRPVSGFVAVEGPLARRPGPSTTKRRTKTKTTTIIATTTTTTTTTTRGGGGGGDHPGLRLTAVVADAVDSSSLAVAVESWRQYVPLVVSVGIIVDILLGNPLANAVLKPLRPAGEDGGGGETTAGEKTKTKNRRSRIDAEAVAQEALDRANNTLELRKFLEERKTDYDRMEEMKRKLDVSMQDLDEDLEARRKSIDGTATTTDDDDDKKKTTP